ncbi:hypothetical protein GLOIN_2v1871466 [Rhizophagus irregularis DAOM 181602=DAOM 197198]|nr:hypothetical protein GLOIN_2v1871466 [Rhizophagus irregularis DAOM 181602=DAOM 197198]
MPVIGMSGSGKTNILGNLFLGTKAECNMDISCSSHEDISKIIRRYTDDLKNASMVINSYLRKGEFVVFDLTRPEDDPLAIRLRPEGYYQTAEKMLDACKKPGISSLYL